jgi:hypothetical protein
MHRYIAFKATPCDTAPPFASLSVTSSAASFNSVEGIGLTWGSSNVRSASAPPSPASHSALTPCSTPRLSKPSAAIFQPGRPR